MSSSELSPPSYPFPTSSTRRKKRSFLIAMVLSLVLLLSPAVTAKTLQRDVLALLALHTEVSSSMALSLTGRGSVDGRWKAAVDKWPVDTCIRAADGSVSCSQDPCGNDWDGNGWEGVTCRYQWDWPKDKPRVVTNIHLPKRGLGGEIPKSLALFRNITELDFDTNALSGALPPEWGCLSNLIEIDLSKNRFTGTVPAAWGNIPGLVEVELDSNTGLSGCVPYGMPPFERWCGGIAMLGSGGSNPCPAFTTDRLIGTSTTQTGIFYGSRCPKPSKPADVTCPSIHDEYFKELVNLFFKEHLNSDSANDAADSSSLANDPVEDDAPVVWQAFSGTNAKASPISVFTSLFGK